MTAFMLVSIQNLKINFSDKSSKYSLCEEADIAGQDNLKKEGMKETASFSAVPFLLFWKYRESDFLPELNGTVFKAYQKAPGVVFEVAALVEQRTCCSFFWVHFIFSGMQQSGAW